MQIPLSLDHPYGCKNLEEASCREEQSQGMNLLRHISVAATTLMSNKKYYRTNKRSVLVVRNAHLTQSLAPYLRAISKIVKRETGQPPYMILDIVRWSPIAQLNWGDILNSTASAITMLSPYSIHEVGLV